MADDTRHIIRHEDGREFSVTRAVFEAVYEPQGFTIAREEGDADFLVTGVPKPKRKRHRPRAKDAAPVAEDDA